MSGFEPSRPDYHLGDALSGLLDGELPPDQEQAAQSHLGGCPSCAEELLAVRQARNWARALPPVDAPFGFYERFLLDRRLQPSSFGRAPSPVVSRANLRRRAGLVAVGAAAAAVTVLGVSTPRQRPVSPAVPRLVEAHATSASVGADVLGKLAPMGVQVSFGR